MENADKVDRLFFQAKNGFSLESKGGFQDFLAAADHGLGTNALHRKIKQRGVSKLPANEESPLVTAVRGAVSEPRLFQMPMFPPIEQERPPAPMIASRSLPALALLDTELPALPLSRMETKLQLPLAWEMSLQAALQERRRIAAAENTSSTNANVIATHSAPPSPEAHTMPLHPHPEAQQPHTDPRLHPPEEYWRISPVPGGPRAVTPRSTVKPTRLLPLRESDSGPTYSYLGSSPTQLDAVSKLHWVSLNTPSMGTQRGGQSQRNSPPKKDTSPAARSLPASFLMPSARSMVIHGEAARPSESRTAALCRCTVPACPPAALTAARMAGVGSDGNSGTHAKGIVCAEANCTTCGGRIPEDVLEELAARRQRKIELTRQREASDSNAGGSSGQGQDGAMWTVPTLEEPPSSVPPLHLRRASDMSVGQPRGSVTWGQGQGQGGGTSPRSSSWMLPAIHEPQLGAMFDARLAGGAGAGQGAGASGIGGGAGGNGDAYNSNSPRRGRLDSLGNSMPRLSLGSVGHGRVSLVEFDPTDMPFEHTLRASFSLPTGSMVRRSSSVSLNPEDAETMRARRATRMRLDSSDNLVVVGEGTTSPSPEPASQRPPLRGVPRGRHRGKGKGKGKDAKAEAEAAAAAAATKQDEEDGDTVGPLGRAMRTLRQVKQATVGGLRARAMAMAEEQGDEGRDRIARKSVASFLADFCVLHPDQLVIFRHIFDLLDTDVDGLLTTRETLRGLRELNNFQISDREMKYVLALLDVLGPTNGSNLVDEFEDVFVSYADQKQRAAQKQPGVISFKVFALMCAFSERIVSLEPSLKAELNRMEPAEVRRRLLRCRRMFLAVSNSITLEELEVELRAGGLDEEEREVVMNHVRERKIEELSFLDYLAYMPLWMGIHHAILENPLDPRYAQYVGDSDHSLPTMGSAGTTATVTQDGQKKASMVA
eukprot:m.144492 g.144492  ORF g.144492 m.144492 type:complete len:940 (-) comp15014_c0_seq1:256-3075(-)